MSLEKKYEDLTLPELNAMKNLLHIAISEQEDLTELIKRLKDWVFSTCFSIKKLAIGYKISEFSIAFKDQQKICVLDLKGTFIEIGVQDFSIAIHPIQSQAPRQHFSYSKFGEKIVIFGGRLEGSLEFLADILIFDINDKTWISLDLENGPNGRFLHSGCILYDYLVVYGGIGVKGWLRDLVMIDLQNLICSKLKTSGFVSKNQAWMKSVCVKNEIFVFSRNDEGGVMENQMLKLTVRNMVGKFVEVKVKDEIFIERVLETCVLENQIVFVGISHNNFCVCVYDTVMDYWKTAKFIEDSGLDLILDRDEFIPLIFQNEVYLLRFFNNFSIN